MQKELTKVTNEEIVDKSFTETQENQFIENGIMSVKNAKYLIHILTIIGQIVIINNGVYRGK